MSTEVPHSGLGTDVFNSVTPLDPGAEVTFQGSVRDEENVDHDDDSASTSSSVSSVVVALASATLADSSWLSAPLYPPQYLSTVDEYIPPSNIAPDEPTTRHDDDDDGFNQEGHPWASEQYENSVHTDHIFDRFNERAAHQPQQCVRCVRLCLRGDWLLSDETTCAGTTSGEFLCRLRRTIYTNNCSRLQRGLLRQLSQGPHSMFSIRRRGLGTTQHLSLPVHTAAPAAYSSISSCRI
jgi:hypothetical protein